MNKKDTYEYLVKEFKKNRIDQRHKYLKRRILSFMDSTDSPDLYILNDTKLKDAIIDYFADIQRLKDFQGIYRVNKNKITAYQSFWLLKRQPIQITVDECLYDRIYPNEEFVASLILKDCINYDIELFSGMEIIRKYNEHIIYFLKYRLTTAQSLEMFIESLKVGFVMGQEFIKRQYDIM